MALLVALLIIATSVYLMVRRVEVRLVLLAAGLLMAGVVGRPLAIADTFTQAMVAAMVAPICASMGFAAVLDATGCDRHLVNLLMAPLRRARWAVLPGGIVAAYLVNLAVPSQASTAAALGPVSVPLMAAVGIRPDVAGAALVLGASFGGDLLNPGAQDVQALAGATGLPARAISARIRPASLVGVLAAAITFTLRNRRLGPSIGGEPGPVAASPVGTPAQSPRLNPVKAIIPLVPVLLLLLAYTGWPPLAWLLRPPPGDQWRPLAGALPVVRAMLIGTLLAAALSWREVQRVIRDLFEGMGAAYGNIISLTIAAQCFGAGIAAIGLGEVLLKMLGGYPWALAALAIGFPWALAALSGSGSGSVLAFAQTFLAPLGILPHSVLLGVLACLAAGFGRTMSPVSAVVIYGSGLVGVSPLALVARLLPALLAGAAMALVTALLLG